MTRSPLPTSRPVLVWGNCQAAPIADLIAPALAAYGCEVARVPPVFEVTADEVAQIQEGLPGMAALVSQPVRDEYLVPGCGTRQLADRLPDDGRLVTFPVVFDSAAFPYQVNAHRGPGSGADGTRVDAPLTDYHDLRAITAAQRGLSVDEALAWWPTPDAAAVRTNAERSRAELERRDGTTDVGAADLLGADAMFTLSHPTNAVLVAVAGRVLRALGVDADDPPVPKREYLGERRAPVEAAVAKALGWPATSVRPEWTVRGRALPLAEVLSVQLPFYAERPDIAVDSADRHRERRALLGLG